MPPSSCSCLISYVVLIVSGDVVIVSVGRRNVQLHVDVVVRRVGIGASHVGSMHQVLCGLDARSRKGHVQLGGDHATTAVIIETDPDMRSAVDLPIATFLSAVTRLTELWKHAA